MERSTEPAFDFEHDGYRFVGRRGDDGQATLTVSPVGGGPQSWEWTCPNYKMWTLGAHPEHFVAAIRAGGSS